MHILVQSGKHMIYMLLQISTYTYKGRSEIYEIYSLYNYTMHVQINNYKWSIIYADIADLAD